MSFGDIVTVSLLFLARSRLVMCHFLVAEQESNQRNQLKGETRLRSARSYSPLRIPLALSLRNTAGRRSEHLRLSYDPFGQPILGGRILKGGRLVKSPPFRRFFPLFLDETRNRAPGGT